MCCEETLTPRRYANQAFWDRIRRILVQSNDTDSASFNLLMKFYFICRCDGICWCFNATGAEDKKIDVLLVRPI